MKKAHREDRNAVIEILTDAFHDNKSVNYIVQQDKRKTDRIKALMKYSFDVCQNYGEVFLSEDNRACALILYPDKKSSSLKSIVLDLKLIFLSIGLKNIRKVLRREALIKSIQPKVSKCYLWFLGVKSSDQGLGLGTKLLNEVLEHSKQQGMPVYLETSTLSNLPWYKRFGFEVYEELDLSYTLYFMRHLHR